MNQQHSLNNKTLPITFRTLGTTSISVSGFTFPSTEIITVFSFNYSYVVLYSLTTYAFIFSGTQPFIFMTLNYIILLKLASFLSIMSVRILCGNILNGHATVFRMQQCIPLMDMQVLFICLLLQETNINILKKIFLRKMIFTLLI